MKVYNGMAVIYLRSVDGESGQLTLKVSTEDLPAATLHFDLKQVIE